MQHVLRWQQLTGMGNLSTALANRRKVMLKIVGWVVGIIFVIGLLVVTGVFGLIF